MTVTVYAGPGVETYRSVNWEVSVNGTPAYVYELTEEAKLNTRWWSVNDQVACALVTIPTDETVEIVVSTVSGDPITSARVYPSRYGITPEIDNISCSFSMNPGQQLLVDINNPDDDDNHAMLFIRTVTVQATPTGPSVVEFDGSQTFADSDETLYFPAGVHDIGATFEVRSRATVFMHGNAWVTGCLDIRGTVDVSILGHGHLSGEDFDHLAIRALAFEDAIEYCGITGTDLGPGGDNSSFANNVVNGIAIWNPGLFSIASGVTSLSYYAAMAPWWYNVNGFEITRSVSDGYVGVASNVIAVSGDDNVMHERNYDHYEISDCFLVNTASACLHLSYWPLDIEFIEDDTGTWFDNIDALPLQLWDSATETGSVVRSQVDGTLQEGRDGWNRSRVFFSGLRVDGPHDGNWLQIVNKRYQWGAQDQARGSISDFTFTDCVLERVPAQLSQIRGYDSKNTPNGLVFERCTIGGVPLSASNFDGYVYVTESVFNVTVDGKAIA